MTDRLDQLLDQWTPDRLWGCSARCPSTPGDWLLAAWHARNAYEPEPIVALRELGADRHGDLVPFAAGHRRGYVWSSLSTACVAIAGSDDARDWMDNVRCACPESAGYRIRVHRGFAEHAEELRTVLDRTLAPLIRGRLVVLVGHSLGGAVATVLPLFSELAEIRSAAAITFGSPRAGDAGLRRFWANRSIAQLAADGDPVPLLPIHGPLYGYRHPSRLIHLTEGGTFVDAWSHRYRRVAGAVAAGMLPRPIRQRIACRALSAVRAHRMATYVRRLTQIYEAH